MMKSRSNDHHTAGDDEKSVKSHHSVKDDEKSVESCAAASHGIISTDEKSTKSAEHQGGDEIKPATTRVA